MSWRRREDLQAREREHLSRWAAFSDAHGGRRLAEADDPMRTAFQRDRDRVIHSRAFRRLQHKTQVMAAFLGDHHRSRMTHSLEVSQMARGVCLALRLNADLAEAIALAHDLGHPPFGHSGETALDELMAGKGGFRHNAHGLRIVDYLEDRYDHGYGLNLVRAVRRGLLKGRVPDGFPVSDDLRASEPAPLEAHVVDLCDRIAYLCHDLEDGLRAGAFAADAAAELRLWRQAAAAARSEAQSGVISEIAALLIHDLVESNWQPLAAAGEVRPLLRHGASMAVLSQELLEFLGARFYRSATVLEEMARGRDKIRAVFAHLVERPKELPEHVRARVGDDGLERAVCDYVAGMTDRFLLRFEI
jgi:dGTPase